MPCNSEYLQADHREIEISKVACLLDELDGRPFNASHWRGYHPAVYNKFLTPGGCDVFVSELCRRLQSLDVTKYSLELQIWWRDHLAADKARIEFEIARSKTREEREAAIAKLTPHEREILGLRNNAT